MKIVIDIPEEIYERSRKYELNCGDAEVLEGAVATGKPLRAMPDAKDRNRILRAVWIYILGQSKKSGLGALAVNGVVYNVGDILQELDALIEEGEGEGARSGEKTVRCIDCRCIQQQFTGQAVPKFICTSSLWKELGRAPHVIGHDEHKPILCDHFEKKEEKHDD